MNYSAEIRSLMAEEHKLHDAAEAAATVSICCSGSSAIRLLIKQTNYAGKPYEFAAINGWRWTKRQFLVRALARGVSLSRSSVRPMAFALSG